MLAFTSPHSLRWRLLLLCILQRKDVLRQHQPLITTHHSAVFEHIYHVSNCIKANNKFNAQRPRFRNSVDQKLKTLIRHQDVGLYVIALGMEQLAPFHLEHDLVNQSTILYCTSATNWLDFNARLSNVVFSVDDFLKVFLSSSVVLFRTSCGRRGSASNSPSSDRCDCACEDYSWLLVVGLVAASFAILAVVTGLFLICRRSLTRRMHHRYRSYDDFESIGMKRGDRLLVELTSTAKKRYLIQRAFSVWTV